jgi:hypothetical protein
MSSPDGAALRNPPLDLRAHRFDAESSFAFNHLPPSNPANHR